jgi:hypothetical protein
MCLPLIDLLAENILFRIGSEYMGIAYGIRHGVKMNGHRQSLDFLSTPFG